VSVPSSELGPPTPPAHARVCPPWNHRGEEQHSLAGEVVGDPIRTTGKKAWHSVYSVGLGIHLRQTETCYCRGGTLYIEPPFPSSKRGGGRLTKHLLCVYFVRERALYFTAEDTFTHA
jgi:hypothetical protein